MLKLLLGAVGWKPLAAIAGLVGLAQLATLGAVGVQTLRLSWAQATIAEQRINLTELAAAVAQHKRELQAAERSIATCVGANEGQAQAIDRILERHKDELAIAAAERQRIEAQKQQVRIVKEKIHVEAERCGGPVHPAIRESLGWVRAKHGLDYGRARPAGDGGGGKDQPGAARPAR